MTPHTTAAETRPSLLDERADAWLQATRHRRSRRRFDGTAVAPDTLAALQSACVRLTPFVDARVVLIAQPRVDVFHGIVGSYGKVTGAPHVLAIIADVSSAAAQAHAGYVGEAAILEATALGLDTCWVGGFFSPRRVRRIVELRPESGERVVAVSPVGHAAGAEPTGTERTMRRLSKAHARLELAQIAPGSDGWPAWAQEAVLVARNAPSAMNRQPWRFRFDDDALVVARDSQGETPRVAKALDCGIAMLHAQLGASGAGIAGRWVALHDGLDVARFEPEARE